MHGCETMTGVTHVNVAVVGAGLSGIGAACRVRMHHPQRSFVVLEARERIGGTWDLFRYPGVRSDSDMATLSFPFRPWTRGAAMAAGPDILSYLHDTVDEFGLTRELRLGTRLRAADFSTSTHRWTLTLEQGGTTSSMTADFLYLATGYYDCETPHSPALTGIDSFNGRVVHPQHWPNDLCYDGSRVLVIGSGATAVTLVPALLARSPEGQAAAHVTMLQRRATWIGTLPQQDRIARRLHRLLPLSAASRAVRVRNIMASSVFYEFCQRTPGLARAAILRATRRNIGDDLTEQQFAPDYRPWDERFCAAPDGDIFDVIRRGDAEVVTGRIDRVVRDGVRLSSGDVLEADVIVTATGLRLRLLDGLSPTVDGVAVPLEKQFLWGGALLSGLPNLAVAIGYPNASWTLRSDLSARLVCRLLTWMDRHRIGHVVPVAPIGLRRRPLLALRSGYIQRAADMLPHQGDRGPWAVGRTFPADLVRNRLLRFSAGLAAVPRHSRTSTVGASQEGT